MPGKPGALSVSELEQLLSRAKKEVGQLQRERAELVAEMRRVDQRLAELGTKKRGRPAKAKKAAAPKRGKGAKAKGRTEPAAKAAPKKKKPGRKKMTLADHITKILAGASAPMSPMDITNRLRAKKASTSKNLSVQVSQILSSDKVTVNKVGRGQYVAAK